MEQQNSKKKADLSKSNDKLEECQKHKTQADGKPERSGRRHCKLEKCKCRNQSCCSKHCEAAKYHCNKDGCKCKQDKCCDRHCRSEDNHCKELNCNCERQKCCSEHCGMAKCQETPSRKIFYDSLVDNEKEYLKKILLSKVYNESMNTRFQFFKWISAQFEAIKIFPVSSTLTESLCFLAEKANTKFLFSNPSNQEKVQEYLKKFSDQTRIDYVSSEFDIFSLAEAAKLYIKEKVLFFDQAILEKMSSLYSGNASQHDKNFVLERLPFIMQNRNTFKILKEIVARNTKNSRDNEAAAKNTINVWSNVILTDAKVKQHSRAILNDLLAQDYDYFSLSFYE